MARGTVRDDRSTRGRKPDDDLRDDHVPAMDPAVVEAALGVVENGLVAACQTAAQAGAVADLIRLHKHFSAIKSRAGGPGGRRTRKAVPAREELDRLDHAFEGCEADAPP